MSLEALSSNEFFNLLINDDSVSAPLATTSLLFNSGLSLLGGFNGDSGSGSGAGAGGASSSSMMMMNGEFSTPVNGGDVKPGQSRRKRRRRTRSCKNKEEAENQRMTHIAVERNRRRQMNEHLAVLRSLMPESYVQRGDQASIVGGAIDFVKELEQLLQSLEAQKRTLIQQQQDHHHQQQQQKVIGDHDIEDVPPFSQFFAYPQYIWCHSHRDCQPESHRTPAMADIEVTLIETHANLRILSPIRPRQLLKLVAGLQALSLTILHLNVTTLDSLVLYSLSTKVEEGCTLTTVDEIAAVVHHMLTLIEAETQSNGPAQQSPLL